MHHYNLNIGDFSLKLMSPPPPPTLQAAGLQWTAVELKSLNNTNLFFVALVRNQLVDGPRINLDSSTCSYTGI